MKILGGELDQSSGDVMLQTGLRLGKLNQNQFAYEDERVLDVVMQGHQEMWQAMQERDRIYADPEASNADYMRAADALVQGSLEEGLGLSPLEALACEVPVVATNVGGMAAHLGNYAMLTPRRDVKAMADALVTIAARADAAQEQAQRGREYVCREWSRTKAFSELRHSLLGASLGVETHAHERAAA